ncbi:response regulator transcription factor [Streptomyces bacillaris]|uniref:DNA-binding response regulator n=1 Tax=Streptomyces cavourensis TaxID=67258 RepID=A0AAD0VE96_9ACTN|nr:MULTISPECIES: response regulator transcription factor [Streptomyces]NUW19971.1 response regulator transcription factor [Streptomyces roseoviolaceus]AXI71480.1 DNA-binding response regulator [Streptomyces cavourensis]NUV85446.1 response regulator transcription factor [Streptomyces sp. KAI-26]UTR81841.1 response regulator transcription factor [Streptomyces cavourensis]WAE65995.1 response regulator transcription factor [Streptomyces cavourensis]
MPDRYARMLDLAVEVMSTETPGLVWPLLTEELLLALDGELIVVKEVPWTRDHGSVVIRSPGRAPDGGAGDDSVEAHIRSGYPFIDRYGASSDWTPQSAARVVGMRTWKSSPTADALRQAFGTHHVFGLPLPEKGPHVSGFLVHRSGGDFTRHDERYAARVQPLLKAAMAHRALLTALRASSGSDRGRQANHALAAPLTPRETNVLHLLATGLTAEGIGRRLGISPRTVHKHLNALYRKLGAADRLSAVLRAQDEGLLRRPVEPSGADGDRRGPAGAATGLAGMTVAGSRPSAAT